MTALSRNIYVFAWTAFALVAAACGQPGSFSQTSPTAIAGRSGGTTGTVITGTVNGLALAISSPSEVATAAATAPVTVSVVGTNISTTIDGSGRFRLDNVPVGDVQLKFAGAGIDATITLKGIQPGDRIDVSVRVTDRSVRIEAERRQSGRRDDDDDDDDDDDEDEDRDDDEFKGTVSALTGTCPNITFILNGVTVKTSNTTRFDGTCARVRNSARVEVHGRRQTDGSIQADRIELDD